jgi:PIN/TRAM domain protein
MLEKILRPIFILLFSVLGIVLFSQSDSLLTSVIPFTFLSETILGVTFMSLAFMLIGAVVGGLIGNLASPYLIRSLFSITSWAEKSLSSISTQDLVLGTAGLFLGLIIANLVGIAFDRVPYIGPYVSVVLSIILGYLGIHLCISKQSELVTWLHLHTEVKGKNKEKQKECPDGKLLDTNIIIDGRIVDVYRSGFLEGQLIVPVFVLEELQKIADSSDVLKRNRGRRGLDILNQFRKSNKEAIRIVTDDFEEVNEVDSKLVKLAREKHLKIITNDYNLNKVAELQGVSVLNLNDLASAVKPTVIPGEQLFVQLVKQGKEENQGVAYLEDGTMIVVENGSRSIGHEVPVIITSVLQNSVGRMIFAKLEDLNS